MNNLILPILIFRGERGVWRILRMDGWRKACRRQRKENFCNDTHDGLREGSRRAVFFFEPASVITIYFFQATVDGAGKSLFKAKQKFSTEVPLFKSTTRQIIG